MKNNLDKFELVQKFAEQLQALDPSRDYALRKTLEGQIAEIELSFVTETENGYARFPLLEKKYDRIPTEMFNDIFVDVLMELFEKYNPEKATFATALSFRLNNRAKNCVAKLKKLSSEIPLTEELNLHAPLKEYDCDEIKIFVSLASLIYDQREMDKSRSKKMWGERFYTFDLAKLVKESILCAEAAISENDNLFPVMEIILLEYLMYGSFLHIRDVVANKRKNQEMLNKRNETIQKCYNISKPTVCNRNAYYYELFKEACTLS